MKMFEEQKVEVREVTPPVVDNSDFIKRNLMKSVTRNDAVYKAIERWLYSFGGGVSKLAFQAQMKRLDFNDEIALTQLEKAIGRRVIPLPPAPKKPTLDRPLIEAMLDLKYVAIYGKGFKSAIKSTIDDLKQCGEVYVLSMEELIIQFKSYEQKGKAPQMIDKAIECDFLFVVDLDMTIHLEWHIREAIERIGRLREEHKKPIVSTWNRFNDCNEFFKRFSIFYVK